MESNPPPLPKGFKILTEGKARILYKEEKLEVTKVGDKDMVRTNKG